MWGGVGLNTLNNGTNSRHYDLDYKKNCKLSKKVTIQSMVIYR